VTFTRVLQRIRCLLRRSDCFRPSDRLAGWDLHPLEIADFSRRTELMTLSRRFGFHGRADGHGPPDRGEAPRTYEPAL
jgi:hypothetical protein